MSQKSFECLMSLWTELENNSRNIEEAIRICEEILFKINQEESLLLLRQKKLEKVTSKYERVKNGKGAPLTLESRGKFVQMKIHLGKEIRDATATLFEYRQVAERMLMMFKHSVEKKQEDEWLLLNEIPIICM